MNLRLSALTTSLPLPFAEAVAVVARLGFAHVDLPAAISRPNEEREALADSGLHVVCAALGRGLPPELSLIADEEEARRNAVRLVKDQIADAAQLGATHVYLVPPRDLRPEATGHFGDAIDLLAEFARGRMLTLCVEHFPGTALPSVAATLDWLRDRPTVSLLLDVGHCLISGEDPARAMAEAGPRLGYVHLDDNDGVGDLHWPLLTGKLTEAMLADVVRGLEQTRVGVALELNPSHGDATENLRKGREIVEALCS